MNIAKRAAWAGLGLLAAIQLVPVDRTNPPVRNEIEAPSPVRGILERACYDCHSNRTRWPWYSRVAPVSWFVADHVGEGRGDLNFTEWPMLDLEEQSESFEDIRKQVTEGKMPLRSYLVLHREARLTPAERETLASWAAENK